MSNDERIMRRHKGEVIPIEAIYTELMGCRAADMCDQAGHWERELEKACKTILEWIDTPAYQTRLGCCKRDGWLPKDFTPKGGQAHDEQE